MSLHKKIHVVLICVIASYVLLSYAILSATVIPAFDDLELDNASRDLRRVVSAIDEELVELRSQGMDWAQWDDAYSFVRGNNPAFIGTNFAASTLSTMNLDFMLFYDVNGRLIQSQVANSRSAQQWREFFMHPDKAQRLGRHTSIDDEVAGVIQTSMGWMLACSLPILTTEARGPVAGTLTLGRLMDGPWVAAKRQQTQVDFRLVAVDDEAFSANPALLNHFSQPIESTFSLIDGNHVLSYWRINDIAGEPTLIVETATPRQATALGSRTVDLTMLFLILAGLLVMVATWVLLQRVIVAPLFNLKSHILSMRESGEFLQPMRLQRSDEIGLLAEEFDALTGQLACARKKLLEQSYKAGMAETAAGVLHNIRNAMTPLVNRIAKASGSIEEARTLRLGAALSEMDGTYGGAGRSAKLSQYVDLAIGELDRLHDTAMEDLRVASEQASQVEAILKEQERLTHSEPVIETLGLSDVVQEAANVVPGADENGMRLELDESINGLRIRAHRLGLVQVLCNVLVNAREAIDRAEKPDGRISLLAVREHQANGGSIIRLCVRDNGVGIESDELTLIFQRGHTSKAQGKGGLGLHWCANTLAGMGGWLSAHSEGPGKGAEFHVHIPEA